MAQPFMAVTSERDEEAYYSRPGWSWGGFMFNVFFAACLKRYWYLLWLFAFWIPFVNIFVALCLMLYFGVKGRELAARSAVFTSKQQYIGFMKGIDHAGKFSFFISLVGLLVVIIATIVLAGLGLDSSREAAHRASAMATARSVIPLLSICREAGGSVEREMPQEGDPLCSTSVLDDTYPAIVDGWRYLSAEDVGADDFLLTLSREGVFTECIKSSGSPLCDPDTGNYYQCNREGCVLYEEGGMNEGGYSRPTPFGSPADDLERERLEKVGFIRAFSLARGLIPIMTICRDAEGSIDALSPLPGDSICGTVSVIDDVYPELPEGWRYGSVREDETRTFVFSITDTKRTIECDVESCREVPVYAE